ncbi:ankyrin repeat protein, putative [Trichomonas vaginalis G3]|uniref:Ankyrin repeat protein, putative n=1 Tax=Trichomonas vaginalis (strain ATCC PRA-98 / G3) TaxID=412133 RepID=A2DRZ7_TRIV3|nr:proteasome regulatory particle assembly [Trichomonas vaginalis G3]EAY16767.1 ankyrin repeat protein, putative [Trichomonas vaginalis G3]KAI5490826.1 proteasome regulatory particle assembly [Trichomonas vaginalis G3]|eukprot:XP_001328990.1 ankyrin repeat protein [Trichomonas vaginalis G3]
MCCYHGAADCFKFIRTEFNSEINQSCLKLSFLGGNSEIISECLKYSSVRDCMEYAIISHNIDFVTFLMNEYHIKIDLEYCGKYNNLEPFLVYFDQTNDINKCFIYSSIFDISSICEYFLSNGANINEKDKFGLTALHNAAEYNCKETAELLISHGANANEKNNSGETLLHIAANFDCKENAELLISHGANVNEKDNSGETPFLIAANYNRKEVAEFFISHGANINEKDINGKLLFII